MDNQIFVSSPYFEKHFKVLIKQRYKNKVEVLTEDNDYTINLLASQTKKCNIKERNCPVILTHSDGSKYKLGKKISKKIKNKFKNKSNWKGSEVKDITSLPSIVRRGFYEISNIIGNKGKLSQILGKKDYLPLTVNIKYDDEFSINIKKIWKTNKFSKRNPVILKPSIGQEQRGIGVCADYLEAIKHIKKVIQEYPNYKNWEIQQYIYKPLSIKGEILFPGLSKNTSISLKDSNKQSRIIKKNGFYKCHIRAYALIVYMKDIQEYNIYLYRKYKFNSAREAYPEDLLNDNLQNIDFSNPWPHKSGGTEGGAMSFDFNELIDYLDTNKLNNMILPNITKKDLDIGIRKQIRKIMIDVLKTAIQVGNCCKPTKDSINTALAIYHPIGADLLIDHNKKVWFIEANPGVGFSLISSDIVSLYKNQALTLDTLDGKNNFNAKLYNLLKKASKKNDIGNIKSFGGLSERYFYLYEVLIQLDEKYQNIYKLREILKDNKEIQILQEKIKNITKKNTNFIYPKDIELIRNTKISLKYKDNIGKDYLEYIRNCRFFWRHTFLDRILTLTVDKLIETNFKHRYQSTRPRSIFYDSDFDLISII